MPVIDNQSCSDISGAREADIGLLGLEGEDEGEAEAEAEAEEDQEGDMAVGRMPVCWSSIKR